MHQRLRITSILDRMTNAAQARAAHYREQAAEFRQMAEGGENDRLHHDLLALAEKYEALADTILATTA
jgi:hypothetical protein